MDLIPKMKDLLPKMMEILLKMMHIRADIDQFAHECGFAHALILQTNSPYRVGAMSRVPAPGHVIT